MTDILVFVSHPDDEIIGVGGTLMKYNKEKKKVVVTIFSYGELSLLKEEYIIKTRILESKRASKLIGCKHDPIFLGLPDGKIRENIDDGIKEKIEYLIKKEKPKIIFTHSPEDPLPDHKAVFSTIQQVLDELNYNCDLYAFEIWNPVSFKTLDTPKLYVDITKYFDKKIEIMKSFKSQQHVMLQMIPLTYARAMTSGQQANCKYAELFYKLR